MKVARSAASIAFLSAVLAGGFAAAPVAAAPKAVIELFTSQGCSSCPPADKLLGDYAQRGDILALSFPIDYWDYLGWKDTLANHDFSERQKAYADGRGDNQIYTPQVVVNGKSHAVGSDKLAIDAVLTREEATGLPVPVSLTASGDSYTVEVGAATRPGATRGTLWLVLYNQAVPVSIGRGENNGRTVTYHNVVRKLRPIAMWKGEALSVDLPKSEQTHAGTDRCAVLLQAETEKGEPGPILGAAVE